MQNDRFRATAESNGLQRLMQTSIAGGSSVSELKELTVRPQRPPGPSVATIPTVITAFRMAARNAPRSTGVSLPSEAGPLRRICRVRTPDGEGVRKVAAFLSEHPGQLLHVVVRPDNSGIKVLRS
jgi:hypothetical protein